MKTAAAVKTIDMTRGPIMKNVFLFALPICLGNVLQQLYGMVDTLVIGNFCGSVSLAAVGTSTQPVEILLCVFLGLGTGVSILVSQYMGRGDTKGLAEVTATATCFLFLCGVPLTVLGQFLGPVILRFMQVPEEASGLAADYIRFVFWGTLGNMGYNMNAGILRGLGDSRASLLFLMISCMVNIVLDLLFVAGFGMDTAGAALATAIAMFSSWFFSIFYIRKHYPELEFSVLPRRMNRGILLSILKIGLPLGLNSSIYSVGHILMQVLVNLQGSAFIAAAAISGKLTGIANIAIMALASASTTFSGQNHGAGNYVYLKKGCRQLLWVSALVPGCACLALTLSCRPVLALFSQDPKVLDLAVHCTWLTLPFLAVYAVFNTLIDFVNGMGVIRFPTVVNLLTLWAVRLPCGWIIVRFFDGTDVSFSISISYLFGLVCMLAYFFTDHWKEICRQADLQQRRGGTLDGER